MDGRSVSRAAIGALYRTGTQAGRTDGELLERFVAGPSEGAESAFAALVDRHGGRVFRVCRSVTHDVHSAEDAFQATFLVLARRARTIRVGEALGPWLHGVALRVASSARLAEERRRRHERTAGERRGRPFLTSNPEDELGPALHREIAGLPRRFRDAVWLCDVEGLGHREAADRLGLPIGTVKSRQARGRERLRRRLTRLGLAPGSALIAASGLVEAKAARCRLVETTTHLALEVKRGLLAGSVPASVSALIEGGQSMTLKNLAFLAGAFTLGAALVATTAAARQDASPSADSQAGRKTTLEDSPPRTARLIPDEASPLPTARVDAFDIAFPVSDRPRGLVPPTEQEVWAKFLDERYPNRDVVVERIGQKTEDCKNYPLAGHCRLVHDHYKGTIRFDRSVNGRAAREEQVVFLDKDHLVRCTEDHGHPKGGADVVPNPGTEAIPATPLSRTFTYQGDRTSTDQEKRLAEVEKKLDRILKVLEGPAVKPDPPFMSDDVRPKVNLPATRP